MLSFVKLFVDFLMLVKKGLKPIETFANWCVVYTLCLLNAWEIIEFAVQADFWVLSLFQEDYAGFQVEVKL